MKEAKNAQLPGFYSEEINKARSKLVRTLLIIAGTFFVGLGIAGILLPLLPTTPFLLLATACYARGSPRFYHWLLNNKWFGNYIKNYREGNISLKAKILTIAVFWATIATSYVVVSKTWARIALILMAMSVTVHILTIGKFYPPKKRTGP
jgi:hypothetical protein